MEFSPDGSLLTVGPAMEAYVEVWQVADLRGGGVGARRECEKCPSKSAGVVCG